MDLKKWDRGTNIKHMVYKISMLKVFSMIVYIDGLMQYCSISSALAMVILQSCTNP